MQRFLISISAGAALLLSLSASATNSLVVQIPQSYYQHPVHLLHPYQNYWHNRALQVEQLGITSFEGQQYTVNQCSQGAQGQALVVLEPNIFYNPKMGVFYSQITAKVYTDASANAALIKPVLTLKAEGQAFGSLLHNPELFTKRAYQQAFDRLQQQLQQHPDFQQTLAQAPNQGFEALCESVDTLTKPNHWF